MSWEFKAGVAADVFGSFLPKLVLFAYHPVLLHRDARMHPILMHSLQLTRTEAVQSKMEILGLKLLTSASLAPPGFVAGLRHKLAVVDVACFASFDPTRTLSIVFPALLCTRSSTGCDRACFAHVSTRPL